MPVKSDESWGSPLGNVSSAVACDFLHAYKLQSMGNASYKARLKAESLEQEALELRALADNLDAQIHEIMETAWPEALARLNGCCE